MSEVTFGAVLSCTNVINTLPKEVMKALIWILFICRPSFLDNVTKSFSFLLLPRVDINSRGGDGQTSLQIAAMQKNGHYMTRILVAQKDIDINAVDNSGRTAVLCSVKWEYNVS